MKGIYRLSYLILLALVCWSCGEGSYLNKKERYQYLGSETGDLKDPENPESQEKISDDTVSPESELPKDQASNPAGEAAAETAESPRNDGEDKPDGMSLFAKSVYPIVRKNCSGCHSSSVQPFFAQQDIAKAYNILLDNGKVDLQQPERSRLYLRLEAENHNCWTECPKDAAEMLSGLQSWGASSSEERTPDIVATEAILVSSSTEEAPMNPNFMILKATDFESLTPPMMALDDRPDGESLLYLAVPSGNGGQRGVDNGMNGEATYRFDVSTPNSYAVWLRVNTDNQNRDSFFISMDDGPFVTFEAQDTGGDWRWVRVHERDNPFLLNLEIGAHSLMIRQRDELARFNAIAVTTTTEDFESPKMKDYKVLRFDLNPMTGKDATLVVNIAEFEASSKTMLLSRPRIETSENIVVKDLMPLVNARFDPQHGTFRIVDKTIEPPGGVLSEATMVLIGERGFEEDELSFSFGKLE